MSLEPWMRDPAARLPEDVKGLIFDCDGTLVDTMPIHYAAWSELFAGRGIAFTEERFYAMAGTPTVRIIEVLAREQGVACDAVAWAEDKERLYYEMMHTARPIDCVVELVKREYGRRKLAVASGGWHRLVDRALGMAGIGGLFDAVVCAEDVKHGKPAPDSFLRAAELIGVRPGNCVVYEDGEPGIVAARAAGIRVVDVRPWYGEKNGRVNGKKRVGEAAARA